MIGEIAASFFLLAGATLSLIAAVGIFRMPDLFTRMQASAKTGTLGVGCTIVGLAIHFGDAAIATRAAMVILFIFLTAPIAAHIIARAGYIGGIKLWSGNVVDELHDRYDQSTAPDAAQPDAPEAGEIDPAHPSPPEK